MHQDRIFLGVALAASAGSAHAIADERAPSREPIRLSDNSHECREKSTGLARMLKKSKRQ